jgi:signal transduction histidine kinase
MLVVIDDDATMRLSCRKILSKVGFRVETFEDGARGLEGVGRLKPELVVVDLKMPGMSGNEVIARIHEIDPYIVIVVITGYATIDTAIEAMKSGAYDFLPKPFSPEELRVVVNRGLERRRLALEAVRAEAERAVLKRRFVTFVSHQLQSPLVAIHQYLDVLKHLGDTEAANAKRKEWIESCLKRTDEMQETIRDWLTLSRLEGESLQGERQNIDIRSTLVELLAAYEQVAASEQVSLEANLPQSPCWVRGDPHCLAVLFENLIVNAIKYNRPGGKVAVSACPHNGEILITVADTGIGIPEKYRPLIFEEFFRVRGEGAKKITGTGLGLSICRRILREMAGSIEVESEVNVGSTFRVRLPAMPEQEVQEKQSSGELTADPAGRDGGTGMK